MPHDGTNMSESRDDNAGINERFLILYLKKEVGEKLLIVVEDRTWC